MAKISQRVRSLIVSCIDVSAEPERPAIDDADVRGSAGRLNGWVTRDLHGFGDDDLGHRALDEISRLGVEVHAVFRASASRRALTYVDAGGRGRVALLASWWPRRGRVAYWAMLESSSMS